MVEIIKVNKLCLMLLLTLGGPTEIGKKTKFKESKEFLWKVGEVAA